jgi:hypothetical protein
MFVVNIINYFFFFDKAGCIRCFFRKPTRPPLNLKRSSKTHQSSLNLKFFLKSTRPSLPLKKAPPLSPSPFPLRVQGMYQPPYSVLKPLRYKVGGPSEVYASSGAAVFCAGMNRLAEELLMGPHCWNCCLWERRDTMQDA